MKNFLLEMWQEFKLAILLIIDCTRGTYHEVPLDTYASLLIMIVYLLSSIDVIPDIIPIVGYIDDFFMIKFVLFFAKNDLEKYSLWRNKQESGVV